MEFGADIRILTAVVIHELNITGEDFEIAADDDTNELSWHDAVATVLEVDNSVLVTAADNNVTTLTRLLPAQIFEHASDVCISTFGPTCRDANFTLLFAKFF